MERSSDAGSRPSDWERNLAVEKAYRIAYAVARDTFRFSHIDAEDVGQEIALRTFKRTHDASVNSSWIRSGAIFLCVDILRARGCESEAMRRLTLEVSAQVELRTLDVDIERAIEHLPLPCQEILRLHFWQGLSWKEIDVRLCAGRRCSQYQARKCLDSLLMDMEARGRRADIGADRRP